jgi:endogenous inhibitor of DNA gyrase (YacG/DUF329 family)
MNSAKTLPTEPAPRDAAAITFVCPQCGPIVFTRDALAASSVFKDNAYPLTRPCPTCGALARRRTQPSLAERVTGPPLCP